MISVGTPHQQRYRLIDSNANIDIKFSVFVMVSLNKSVHVINDAMTVEFFVKNDTMTRFWKNHMRPCNHLMFLPLECNDLYAMR